jgi:hypothetical protein
VPIILTEDSAYAGMNLMRIVHFAACLAFTGPLAACASGPAFYPQPYIGKGTPVTASPADVAAFKARTLHTPPRAQLQDLAESYISREVQHPSSVRFQNEFESSGRSVAGCGRVTYRDKDGRMTPWRPFFVEFTAKSTKGTDAPYTYNPEDELAKLCGPMAATPNG